jgi:CheY-like chemotaxis protein
VTSEPGKGTEFTVYLPEISGDPLSDHHDVEEIVLGQGTILAVDDEIQVLDYMQQVLDKAGYDVICFSSSPKALQAIEEAEEAFDLIITDMAMPEMTGLELFHRVREKNADVPVLLCTGYSEHISSDLAKKEGINGYLEKPFTPEQLSAEVKSILQS